MYIYIAQSRKHLYCARYVNIQQGEMFSVNVGNSRLKCCHHTPTRGDCSVMSSRTLDQPMRRPDGRTCWDGDAAPRADDDWRNVDADDWRRQRRTYSSPPGTGELCVVDTDELSDRAWSADFSHSRFLRFKDIFLWIVVPRRSVN